MQIALAQINCTVGDLAGNSAKIRDFAKRAAAAGATLMVTPELALSGYPPEDLLLRAGFYRSCHEALTELAKGIPAIALVVGHPLHEDGRRYNAASLLKDGKVARTYRKLRLPNYTVFDEARYFSSADTPCVFEHEGVAFGITICEDAWDDFAARQAREAGAEVLLVLNASPYHMQKFEIRHQVMRSRIGETGMPALYINMVGGQDELVFDGGSFAMNGSGALTHQFAAFEETLGLVKLEGAAPMPGSICALLPTEAEVWRALTLGVTDYIGKNGFPGVLLGLSGGIDSALTLAIAVDALGAQKVRAIMMPSAYTSEISLEDSRAMVKTLGVRYDEIPIAPVFDCFLKTLRDELAGRPADTTEENLQSRIRGVLLMALSNKTGAIVLNTGNKSELGTGYSTLYGDMAGGFAVLKDISKTLVYRLARYRNSLPPAPVIPERVITRAPTAELKPGQTDQDSLPPYPTLDAIMEAFVERDLALDQIIALGHSRQDVARVAQLITGSEYKRRQAPVGIRITNRGFGKDWRYPITNKYRHSV